MSEEIKNTQATEQKPLSELGSIDPEYSAITQKIQARADMDFSKEPVVVSFKNVSKTYKLYKTDKMRFLGLFSKRVPFKLFRAMNHVDLEIHKGESVGIMGRNGAGKSTMLKLITGVTFPDEGVIETHGQVAALLELTAGFDSEMTGRENIYLKGYILGLSKERIAEIEDAVIDFAEIGDFIDQPVRTYSSGMKARLGFAINVCIDPDILVIDEALSVGDAAFGEKCRIKIAEIIEKGVTVLFVSHSNEKIKEFCTRAILLEKGTKLAEGEIDDITEQYNQLLKKTRKPAKKTKIFSLS